MLEARFLLSTATVSAKSDTFHIQKNIQARVAFGGKIAKIRDTDLELYNIVVVGPGHVRAQPMAGGRVKIILDGTTASTTVAVNPSGRHFHKGTAHEFPPGAKTGDGVLHIGNVQVNSGTLGQFLAYQTAQLEGVFSAKSTAPIDRIAFYSYQPGASIITGGDVNTLNAFKDLNLAGGPSISIGRDLNWMQVGGSINISSGSSFEVGRDIGLAGQPAKGTDSGGQGALVKGDLNVNEGGLFIVGRSVDAPFVVDGVISGVGVGRYIIPNGSTNFIPLGGFVEG